MSNYLTMKNILTMMKIKLDKLIQYCVYLYKRDQLVPLKIEAYRGSWSNTQYTVVCGYKHTCNSSLSIPTSFNNGVL